MIEKLLLAGIRLAKAQRNGEPDPEALRELVRVVEDYFNPGRSDAVCKFCGAPLVWIVTGKGAKAPLDAASISGLDEGGIHRRIRLSHFATCPDVMR